MIENGVAAPAEAAARMLKEHLHTRVAAKLFDISHMGQLVLARVGLGPRSGTINEVVRGR